MFEFLKRKAEVPITPIKEIPNAKKKRIIYETPVVISGLMPPEWDKTKYLEASISWVNACVNIIADVCAGLDIHLYDVNKKGELEELYDHPLLDLIYKPNALQSKFDFFYLIFNYLELAGEAPILLDLKGKIPQGMYLLRPDKLGVKFGNQDGMIDYYEYQKTSYNSIRLEPEEIIRILYPDPARYYRGKGTLEALKSTVDTDNFAEEWNKNFFYNSARPDFVLQTDANLKDDKLKRLRLAWNNFFGRSVKNAHKMAILDGGLKIEKLGMSQKDMDFIEQSKFTRDKILSVFRVPKSVLGITEDVNRANAEASYYVFAKYCIKPKMTRLIEQLNEFLVPVFGDNLILDFDDPVPEDFTQKLAMYQNALANGWMTVNEIRDIEGYEDLEGGDVAYMPMGKVPLGGYEDDDDDEVDEKKLHFSYKAKKIKDIKRRLKQELKPLVRKEIISKKHKEYQAKRKAIWEVWLNRVKKYREDIRKIAVNAFKEQEKQVLDSINQKNIKRFIKKKDLDFSEEEENEKYMSKFEKAFIALVIAEGVHIFNDLKVDKKFELSAGMKKYINEHSFELVKGINQTTKKRLKKEFQRFVEKGEDLRDLRKRVQGVFEEATKSRAVMIARTESSAFANKASIEAYKESGVVAKKEWLVDGMPCDICTPMDGQTVGLEGYFRGGDGSLYDDPPVHPNCMCTTQPVRFEERSIKIKEPEEYVNDEFKNLIKELKEIENEDKKTKK